MLLTLILPLILWFWVSLCYSLVTLAFHVPMRSMFGHGGFPLYWMLNWVSQAALGFGQFPLPLGKRATPFLNSGPQLWRWASA